MLRLRSHNVEVRHGLVSRPRGWGGLGGGAGGEEGYIRPSKNHSEKGALSNTTRSLVRVGYLGIRWYGITQNRKRAFSLKSTKRRVVI